MNKRNEFNLLVVLLSVLILPTVVWSQDPDINYIGDVNSIKLNKTVAPVPGSEEEYMINLEAYVTGNEEKHDTKTYVPTDMALVVDLSGSMAKEISDTERYANPSSIQLSYNNSIYPDFTAPYPVQEYSWKSDHPVYFATYAKTSNSEFYIMGVDGKLHEIIRKSGTVDRGQKILGVGSVRYYYMFYEIDETFEDPWNDPSTYKKRYFLGKDSDGTYHARYFGPTVYPAILKDGKVEGSDKEEDYEPATGYFTTNPDEVMYEGTFYTGSRLDALRGAVKTFLKTVAKDDTDHLDDTSGHHKVGLVKFSGAEKTEVGNDFYPYQESSTSLENYSQIAFPLTEISSGRTDFEAMIDQLYAGGVTNTENGLIVAENMLNIGDTRQKTIILFTDGEPTLHTNFETEVANKAIAKAKELKAKGVKIYVVGLAKEKTDNADKFMQYVSSNYPTAESMSNPGEEGKKEDKYYSLANTGAQLNSIFEAIANQTAETTVGYNLGSSSSLVLDALTDNFKLPADVTSTELDRIKVFTYDLKSLEDGVYTFNETGTPFVPTQKKLGGTDNDQILIEGFDFSANWCGLSKHYDSSNALTETVVHGKKLVIQIPIIKAPKNPGGGAVPTNEPTSGIYPTDSGGQPDMENPVTNFPIPTLCLPNIVISKSGMKKKESAMFRITKLKEDNSVDDTFKPYTMLLTADENGKAKAKLKLVPVGKYKVEELSWSWAYTPATPQTKQVDKTTENATELGTLFEFTNEGKKNTPAHGESEITNKFYTPTTVNK